jgi:hypothetical protein
VATKRILQGFPEQDVFTGWRHVLHWQAGVLRKAKRRYHKKERRSGRREIRDQQEDR